MAKIDELLEIKGVAAGEFSPGAEPVDYDTKRDIPEERPVNTGQFREDE